ncbi:hypothetical protein EYF80_050266 [Liparis tanakae]|uniref:Uncharacterized protein n=1 Tax=Liparis tanakae TaxID=230148 RepID=A0A4Z2FFA0_9TELE|nr:hypothetical protein EYF80_050266 [Liparis tanakae]
MMEDELRGPAEQSKLHACGGSKWGVMEDDEYLFLKKTCYRELHERRGWMPLHVRTLNETLQPACDYLSSGNRRVTASGPSPTAQRPQTWSLVTFGGAGQQIVVGVFLHTQPGEPSHCF